MKIENRLVRKLVLTVVGTTFLLSGSSCQEDKPEATETTGEEVVIFNNPVVKNQFTADPAPLVHDGVFYLYTGHDEQAEGGEGFLMKDWLLFSTTDMVNWTSHGAALQATSFAWANGQAWAAHVVEKDDKFYWYVTVEHGSIPGKAIGVAVADSPLGPWKDAIGEALITNDMTTQTNIFWDDIDPAVFVDDDGSAFIYWGNSVCKWARLKDNMVELDGPIHTIPLPAFTEAPWVHKRGDYYYLSYASQFPEVIDYAMSTSPEGPWEPKGRLNELVPNSPTNHQGIVEYKDNWYFVYHNGRLPTGGEFRRSVCIDYLYYSDDNTLKKVQQTMRGVDAVTN